MANIQIYGTLPSGGTSNYEELENKPSINNVELKGNKTTADLGLEGTTNKVTTISSASTNTEYPSALAVYNYVDTMITQAIGGSY